MTKAALALLAILSGCTATYILRPGDLPPMIAQTQPEQKAAIWQRAINVLLDEGYVPQVLNADAGYISAKQREDLTVGGLAGTIALVYVAPDGRLRVGIGGSGVYHDEAELKRDLNAIQQRVTQEIMQGGVTLTPVPKPAS